MKKLKCYEINTSMVIETYSKYVDKLEWEIVEAIVDVVEKYKSYVGGGLHLKEVNEDEI